MTRLNVIHSIFIAAAVAMLAYVIYLNFVRAPTLRGAAESSVFLVIFSTSFAVLVVGVVEALRRRKSD